MVWTEPSCVAVTGEENTSLPAPDFLTNLHYICEHKVKHMIIPRSSFMPACTTFKQAAASDNMADVTYWRKMATVSAEKRYLYTQRNTSQKLPSH